MNHFLFCTALLGLVLFAPTAPNLRAADPAPLPQIDFDDCPAAVQHRFTVESKGAKIETVESDQQDEETWYTAEVLIKGRSYSITVADDGTLIQKTLNSEDVRQIPFADCPDAVRKTFTEESGDTRITTVEKETCNGVVTYRAAASIDEQCYSLTVAHDGTLLDKVLDDSSDEEEVDDADQDTASRQMVLSQSTLRSTFS